MRTETSPLRRFGGVKRACARKRAGTDAHKEVRGRHVLNPDPAAMEKGRKPRYQLDPDSDAWTREMQPEKQNPAYELPEFRAPVA